MINNTLRHGNFTSSKIAALHSMGSRELTEAEIEERDKKYKEEGKKKTTAKTVKCWPGKAAITYIKSKNKERRAEQSVDREIIARPLSWGKLCEACVFQLLPTDYILSSSETTQHPIISWWAGSKDAIRHTPVRTVGDIKCPITISSFCDLVDGLYLGLSGWDAMQYAREHHDEGETYYWQIVSNACIDNCTRGELIVYMPYFSELEAIRRAAHILIEKDPANFSKYNWITYALDDELPFLKDDGMYKNINVITFDIPEEDKELLTRRVLQAGRLLQDNPDALKFQLSKEDEAEVVYFLQENKNFHVPKPIL